MTTTLTPPATPQGAQDMTPLTGPTAASARLHLLAHRAARVLTWALVVVMILTVANWVSELILPAPANAVPGIPDLTQICNPNYQLPEPGNPTVGMDGGYVRAGPQELWVTPESGSYIGAEAHGAAYGTGGMTWHTYGTSLCQPLDYTVNITTLIAGFVLSWLVAAASLMGFVMQAAFTTNIIDAVLLQPDLARTMTSMNENLWQGWYPLILGIAILGIAYLVLRARVQEAGGRFLWVVIATALITGLALTPGALGNLGVQVNQLTRDLSTAAMGAVNGGSDSCETMSEVSDAEAMVTCMSTNMANDFVYPVWSVGAAGTRADESAPIVADNEGTTNGAGPDVWIHWNTENDEVGDDVNYAATQLPPAGVVPTQRASGIPTTSEYLRWTQSYTAAEAKALEENAGLRCSQTGSPNLEDLGRMASLDDPDSSDDLCVKKWAVRAGILYGLKASDPSAYAAATGKDDLNSRISPAVMSMPISTAAEISMMVVAFMMFFYQLEFLVYWFLVIVFLIASLVKGPKVMTSWAGWVAATCVKRIGLGLLLGFALLVFQWIQRGLVNISLDGWGALLLVFTSVISQVIFLGGMIAVVAVWFKLKKVLLTQTRLERYGTSKPVEAAKGVGSKALAMGSSAAVGGATGGVPGAVLGAGTTAVSPKTNLTAAMRKGASAGDAITRSKLTNEKATATLTSSQSETRRLESEGMGHRQTAQDQTILADTAANESRVLEGQATTATTDANRQDALVKEGVTSYVTEHVPEGRTVSDELATADIAKSSAQTDLTTAVESRAEFAHQHDLSHMHQLDENGNLTITDLSTGQTVTTPDIDQYRPDLSPEQIFTSPEMVQQYQDIEFNELAAQEELSTAEIKQEAAQADMDRLVSKYRKEIGQMNNSEIDRKFADNPELAEQAREWKATQLRVQNLHRQSQELNKRSLERMRVSEQARAQAQREEGMAQASDAGAHRSRQQGDDAQRTLDSNTGAKAAATQLLHSAGGRSRRH